MLDYFQTKLLEKIHAELVKHTTILSDINSHKKYATGIVIQQNKEKKMALVLPLPGNTLGFTAALTPSGSVLPTGNILSWTSSDPTNAPVTVDPTGFICECAIGAAAPANEVVILTATGQSQNASGAPLTITGTIQFTIGTAAPPFATGVSITQTT